MRNIWLAKPVVRILLISRTFPRKGVTLETRLNRNVGKNWSTTSAHKGDFDRLWPHSRGHENDARNFHQFRHSFRLQF